eukprot:1290519-Rhodomonas_salina.2
MDVAVLTWAYGGADARVLRYRNAATCYRNSTSTAIPPVCLLRNVRYRASNAKPVTMFLNTRIWRGSPRLSSYAPTTRCPVLTQGPPPLYRSTLRAPPRRTGYCPTRLLRDAWY